MSQVDNGRHPNHRRLSIVVAILMVTTGTLVIIGGSAAQSPTIPEGAGAVLPDAENAVVVLEDDTNDAQLLFAPAGTGGTALDGMADIVDVEIAENEASFRVAIRNREYNDELYYASRMAGGDHGCSLNFNINGYDRATYGAYLYSNLGQDLEPYFFAYAYRYVDTGDYYDWEWLGEIPAGFTGQRLEMAIDKALLDVSPRDRALRVGDRLGDITVSCWYAQAGFFAGQFFDWVSSSDARSGTGQYRVSMAPGSSVVSISLKENGEILPAARPLTVAAGLQTKRTLALDNIAEHKLIVNITAEMIDENGAPLPGWTVVAPPTLEVAAGTSTQASLVITSADDATHRDSGYLRVLARPLGKEDDSATLRKSVIVTQPLGPDVNTLNFHNGWRGGCFFVACLDPTGELPETWDGDTEWFVLNPLEQDPIYDREQRDDGIIRNRPWADAGTVLDTPLVKPIRFDPEGTIDITLGLASEVPRAVEIEIDMMAEWGDLFISSNTATLELTSTPTAHTIQLVPREDALELAAGEMFQTLMVIDEVVTGANIGGIGAEIKFYPDLSKMELPLLPVTEASFDITDGRALPTLQARNGTELEEYVNPGKKRVFDLALTNEGSEKDVLDVRADDLPDGWKVQILPGNRFQLDPGQSAPFSVVVQTPGDAREQQIVAVNLSATSANDADVRTSLALSLIVTGEIQFEDEEYQAPSENEAVAPYVGDAEEASSAATMLLVPFVLGLLGPFLRRRD